MQNRTYFIILKYLAKNIGHTVDITDLSTKLFPNTTTEGGFVVKNHKVEELLIQMKNNGHIEYESPATAASKHIPYSENITAIITTPGFMFYNLYNKTKWGNLRSWIAIIIAAASAFFTAWPLFNKHNSRPEETKSQSLKSNKELHQTPTAIPKNQKRDIPR